MERGYQDGFSDRGTAMFNEEGRRRKAATMVAVLREAIDRPLETLELVNVGGSAGIIDEYLARHFGRVTGIDIDEKAIHHARDNYQRDNLAFEVGDAMDLQIADASVDVVVCSQVYEHVPDAGRMMAEIHRVLKPGGLVYFAAGNRLMWNEPHYNLPLLSVLPRPLAHLYIRLSGKADFYYEKHLSWWGLRRLVRDFKVTDYTPTILADPTRYEADYMVRPGSRKQGIASFIARYLIWLVPGYIWLLEKQE